MRLPRAWFTTGTLMVVLASAAVPILWTTEPAQEAPAGPPPIPAVSLFLRDHPEFGSPIRAEPPQVLPPGVSQQVKMSDRRRLNFFVIGDGVRSVYQVPSDGMPTIVWEDGR